MFFWTSSQVRSGEKKNGTWHVQVEKAGEYEIALRRWPRGVDVPLSGSVLPIMASWAIFRPELPFRSPERDSRSGVSIAP